MAGMTDRWSVPARRALDPGLRGVLRVLGGPGTGKTSLLVDAAAAHIAAGTDPRSVLLLTGSGRIGTAARTAMTTTLLRANPAGPAVIRDPVVRTVHGYAFAVLRQATQRAGDLPPRLVTGAEQDGIIRELLAGDLDDAAGWPESLRPALSTDGFATELRNLMARCAERGVDPAALRRIGRRSGRPEWIAAGRFAEQYEQVMLLRAAVGTAAPQARVPALGAAELVGAALEAFAADADLLAAERARVRVLLVDDAQQLDPQAARLVRVLAGGADTALLAGDPDQAVFGFRGAEPGLLLSDATAPSVTLPVSHRCAPAVAHAIGGIARRLPGPGAGRNLQGSGVDAGSVTVLSAASGHAEAALIADRLRRAHLIDDVPWSQMAVIVRSVPRAAQRLPRALAAAGVPVTTPGAGGSLSEHPAVAALLTVLAATADGLTGQRALSLMTGPIGRVDPISLRQLARALRRAGAGANPPADLGELLATACSKELPDRLPAAQARPLRRVRAVVQAAARCHRDGRDPRYTLWHAWHRSGLQQRWLAAGERGGPGGAQADRDLDAVSTLFDVTEQYVTATAGVSLSGLIDHVTALQLLPAHTEPAPRAAAVSVFSAHAALGHEWDLVVVAGLQEGLWPNTIPRGGVLRTQRLLDELDGVGAQVSARAPLLAEERRLLVSAMGRARRRLLVTAVDGAGEAGAGDEVPSGLFAELGRFATADADRPPVEAPRVLSAAAVVGRLRAVVSAPPDTVGDDARARAATQLARLANAGVAGADPGGWYGMAPVSTDEPLWRPDHGHVVTLSPSTLQTLADCPLRWLAERHGGTDGPDLRSTIGSELHALIAAPGKTERQLLADLDRLWQRLPFESSWYSANELARHQTMLAAFVQWRAATRHQLTEVGVEVDVDGIVDDIRLRGRIDRVERDRAGRVVVVDVKTGKSPVTKDDAQRHAQLALYQLAVEAGLVGNGDEPGGARLVYLGKPTVSGATEREQAPLTLETSEQWRSLVAAAGDATAGPQFAARVNAGCGHCPIRPNCPAHTEGTRP